MAVAADGAALALDARFQHAVHGFQEIVAVRLDVEAHQIGAQQPVQQFALPGANPERFRIGPGNVPEDRHPGVRARALDQLRQQGEMVVLHHDHRTFFVADLFQHGRRELPVDGLVMFPVFRAERGPGVRDVAQRP